VMPELRDLVTEQADSASEMIDECSTEDGLRIMNREDSKVAAAVAAEIPRIARAVDAIVEVLDRGGRLFHLGAGTSGRLGVLDAAECEPTFGCAPGEVQAIIAGGREALWKACEPEEDRPELGVADLRASGFAGRDALVAISSSGRTPFVLGAVQEAHRLGALTVGVACNTPCELDALVDIFIGPVTGPEVIGGSTRLKAGTATKMVLNMISTMVMVRRGYVMKNLMVNVRPSNSKLLERARSIVAQLVCCERTRAAELLDAAGGSIKTAVVMGRLGIAREEAELRLERAVGRLSRALAG